MTFVLGTGHGSGVTLRETSPNRARSDSIRAARSKLVPSWREENQLGASAQRLVSLSVVVKQRATNTRPDTYA
jgi:hypothetical protein